MLVPSLPTSTSDTFQCDVGAQVEGSDYLGERDVVVVVDDGGGEGGTRILSLTVSIMVGAWL